MLALKVFLSLTMLANLAWLWCSAIKPNQGWCKCALNHISALGSFTGPKQAVALTHVSFHIGQLYQSSTGLALPARDEWEA